MIEWLVRQLIPIVRFFGTIRAPWSVKLIDGEDVERILGIVRPGDVFVTRCMGQFTNWIIPGYWKHAGIMGTDDHVLEAVGSGVVETDLISFLTSKDEVAIVRPTFCKKDIAFKAANAAHIWLGAQYDFEFSLGEQGILLCGAGVRSV